MKRGQTWQLDRHVLFCGSNKDMPLPPKKPDILMTDPPFAIDYHNCMSGKEASIRIAMHGDGSEPVAFPFHKYTRRGGAFLIFYAAGTLQKFLTTFPPHWQMTDVLIWDKRSGNITRNAHGNDKELVIYGKIAGAAHRRPPDRNKLNSILRWRRIPKNIYHPTQKPVGLMKELIEYHTRPHDVILEPYGGSGTTLLAAAQSDRVCYAAEYEPHYCDIIIERWQGMTGLTAKLQ